MDKLRQRANHTRRIGTIGIERVKQRQRLFRLAAGNGLEQVEDPALIRQSQHGPHVIAGDIALAQRNGLIQQRQTIPRGSIGCAGDQLQRRVFDRNAFFFHQRGKERGEVIGGDTAQVKTLAPAAHRNRDAVRFCGREEKLHMRWRLFKRLQQRVERAFREHVNFINNVNFVA